MRDYLTGCLTDVIPAHSTFVDLSSRVGPMRLPTALFRAVRQFFRRVTLRRSKFVKAIESKYLCKCQFARNVRLSDRVRAKFAGIRHSWVDRPKSQMTVSIVLAALDAIGLRIPIHQRGLRITDVEPPREAASMGLFIQPGSLLWHVGHKGKIWALGVHYALKWLSEFALMSSELRWDNVANVNRAVLLGQALATKYKWVYVPTWRLDGGPDKLRMLLIGNIVMYIIEMWFWRPFHEMMLKCPNFGYSPKMVRSFFKRGLPRGWGYLSGDFEAYDENEQLEHLKSVYQAVQIRSGMPEWLGVLLYLYQAFTPALVVDAHERIVVRFRLGQAPSGIGGFSFANSIGCLAVNFLVFHYVENGRCPVCVPTRLICAPRYLLANRGRTKSGYNRNVRLVGRVRKRFRPGIYMGDDHVQPLPNGVMDWYGSMYDLCGLSVDTVFGTRKYGKPKGSLLDFREYQIVEVPSFNALQAVFLRRVWSKGSGISEPVYLSLLRNALYPEHGDPNAIHRLRRAVMYRAQGLEIYKRLSDKLALAAWEWLVPSQHCLWELGGRDDLSRLLQLADAANVPLDDLIVNLSRRDAWSDDQEWSYQ